MISCSYFDSALRTWRNSLSLIMCPMPQRTLCRAGVKFMDARKNGPRPDTIWRKVRVVCFYSIKETATDVHEPGHFKGKEGPVQ